KGSRGRGPKTRLVPAINQVAELLDWWMVDVRHQFDDDWQNPDAPLLPCERTDPHTGAAARVGDQTLRDGLAMATQRWLPHWPRRGWRSATARCPRCGWEARPRSGWMTWT